MYFIMWVALGVLVGRMASLFTGNQEGTILDILVGIIGSVVAGFLMTPLLNIIPVNQNPFNFPAMLVSIVGAASLLVVLNLLRRRGYRLQ